MKWHSSNNTTTRHTLRGMQEDCIQISQYTVRLIFFKNKEKK